MKECLRESDLLELTRESLAGSDQRLAAIPKDLCAPFYDEARTVETELLAVYRVAALCAKREDDLDRVSRWWGSMVEVCDIVLERLRDLSNARPACGAEYYCDRVLDLRNKCHRLQTMHS